MAALIKAIVPQWDFQQIKDCLPENVDINANFTGRMVSNGRLNLERSVVEANKTRTAKVMTIINSFFPD